MHTQEKSIITVDYCNLTIRCRLCCSLDHVVKTANEQDEILSSQRLNQLQNNCKKPQDMSRRVQTKTVRQTKANSSLLLPLTRQKPTILIGGEETQSKEKENSESFSLLGNSGDMLSKDDGEWKTVSKRRKIAPSIPNSQRHPSAAQKKKSTK